MNQELYIQEKEVIEVQINYLINLKLEDEPSNIENVKSILGVSNKRISAILGEGRFKKI